MDSLNLVNMYYNLIFNYNPQTFKYTYEDYDRLQQLKLYLDQYDIRLSFIHSISKDTYEVMLRSKSFEKYDIAFNTAHNLIHQEYVEQEKQKYQVLILSGREDNICEYVDIDKYQDDSLTLLTINDLILDEIHINGPYSLFLNALYQIDYWPGIFVFKGEQWSFTPVKTLSDIDDCFERIRNHTIFNQTFINIKESYFIQLSDLHLGSKKTKNGLTTLNDSLDSLCKMLPKTYQLKFLITGDLMNSPNRKNMHTASSFMNRLKREYQGDVTFVLGNHDMIVHGLNFLKRQKTKVVAYLLGENIKVYPDMKIIVIKLDSTAQGNLARGKVGMQNLDEIEEELMAISNIEDYTLIAMIHHHLRPIDKDQFLKDKWNDRYIIKKISDSTKALVDANEVLTWLKKHRVKYVFHGHKHIPNVIFDDGVVMMACGTSCGGETKEKKSKYISYNMLKYNHEINDFKYCFIFYDDITKQERRRIKITLFNGD